MPYNKDLYKTTVESFGVKKPSKLLTDQARNIANGIKGEIRLIKMEIARLKLLELPSVTAKQQEKINKLTADIDAYLAKPKPVSKKNPPIDPRRVQSDSKGQDAKPNLKRSDDEDKTVTI